MTREAKHELFTILSNVVGKLDISIAQHKKAKERYLAVGKWLSEGIYCNGDVCLQNGEIYPQGSMRLATAVRPIGQEEFDVDLIFFSPNVSKYDMEPTELNRLIGDRLRENDTYREMMEKSPGQGRLKRGWRIPYDDKFHLDITPSINNDSEANSSEYVPDRQLQDWKPSNPKDYASWFDECAKRMPQFEPVTKDGVIVATESHEVKDFPEENEQKPLLKRYVQILKRHRDEMFKDKENKPISIIITTLATHAYNDLMAKEYDNELDLLVEVLRKMPNYIEGYERNYKVRNHTTNDENFAERWNDVPAKKRKFDEWHENALIFFEKLYAISGQDKVFVALEEGFGKKPVLAVYDDVKSSMENSRINGLLGLGLSSSATAAPVEKNTFFGK